MENATKALFIAAGVLIGIMLISLIIVGKNRISEYYSTREQTKASEQAIDFNKQYSVYNRNDVRGTDLISLVNKILDFNITAEGDGVDKILIDIIINENDKTRTDFCYQYEEYYKKGKGKLIKFGTYTQDNITNFVSTGRNIENKYSIGMATKLAANLSTLLEGDDEDKKYLSQQIRKNVDTIDTNEILQYYQYQQFKRAHFDCKLLTYTDSGRVQKFIFEYNGKIE